MNMPPDRYTQTLAIHTGTRTERVSYTPVAFWWSFSRVVPAKVMTWGYS